MLPAELIARNQPLANPAGRQSVSAQLTLAAAALEHAQAGAKAAAAAQEAARARAAAVEARRTDIQQELKTLRLQIATEAIHSLEVAGHWTPSVTQAMAKPAAKRQALLAEGDTLSEVATFMRTHFTQDAPKLHRAQLAEAQAGLDWLSANADLATVDLLLAVAPLMQLDPNLNIVAASGSVISTHCIAISEQTVAVDAARAKLRDAETQAQTIGAN